MTKLKTLSAVVIVSAALATPAFARPDLTTFGTRKFSWRV